MQWRRNGPKVTHGRVKCKRKQFKGIQVIPLEIPFSLGYFYFLTENKMEFHVCYKNKF